MFNKISNKELIDFNKTFSLMLLSHLSIIQSLELLLLQNKNKHFKLVLKSIITDVKSGKSLSKSFSKFPNYFSHLFIANLRVGEETGEIAEVMNDYAIYEENIFSLKKKIIQASRYPLLVIFVAILVITFMVFFLIPSFEGLFSSSDKDLPSLTKVIIDLSYLIKNNFLTLIIFLIIISTTLFYFRKHPIIKNNLDLLLVKTPYLSSLYRKNILARFSYSMAIMLKSKVTLIDALLISKDISGNELFKLEIEKIIKKINKGNSLSVNINKSYFFDLTFSKLLLVGEESAVLDKVFSLISNYYIKEFDYQVEGLTSLIEPILILFIGGIVAIILIAMYLPMFELVNNFGM